MVKYHGEMSIAQIFLLSKKLRVSFFPSIGRDTRLVRTSLPFLSRHVTPRRDIGPSSKWGNLLSRLLQYFYTDHIEEKPPFVNIQAETQRFSPLLQALQSTLSWRQPRPCHLSVCHLSACHLPSLPCRETTSWWFAQQLT